MAGISTIFLQEFPKFKIIQALAKKKRTKVYLVGGFLRDYVLERECFDFDFAVSKDAIGVARIFAKKIKGAFVLLDEGHGCARVVRPATKHGGARSRHSLKANDGSAAKKIFTFDFADFRKKTLTGDLSCRDFTINTLCVDVGRVGDSGNLEKNLVDLKGALKDIKARTIKMVSKESFKEDPLRLVRAFSLAALLGFTIEKKTLAQVKRDKNRIREVAYERIRDEFFKILATEKASSDLKAMDKIGFLDCLIPQLGVMYDCTQGGYHHLDVWPHSLETMAQLEKVFEEFKPHRDVWEYLNEPFAALRPRLSLLKLAALLHDIGKPQTKKKEGGRTSFHGHEKVGQNITRHIALMMKLSTRERRALEDMVLWHLRPGYLSNFKLPSERSIFRYFRDTQEEAAGILLLSLADQRATRGPLTTADDQKHHEDIVKSLIARYFDKRREKPFVRLIDGNDLIRRLHLKPSPLFAKILREVEEKQATEKIHTQEEALSLARKMAIL